VSINSSARLTRMGWADMLMPAALAVPRSALWQHRSMAVIHWTTLKPSKLELLTTWLPTQPWYRGGGTPSLAKAGGFRLDDPAGEVGIELMIVTDTAGPEVDAYLVPLTYRATPGEGTPIGTMDHGVLGMRYAYDGPTDAVFRSEVDALLRGEVSPQSQSESDTIDRTVRVAVSPGATGVQIVRRLDVAAAGEPDLAGTVSAPWCDPAGAPYRSVVLRTS
jgi:hypothetical protein